MMELMKTDDAMNNLYIFHLKFMQKWNFVMFTDVLMRVWNDFGLFNYNTQTQTTLAAIKFVNNMEDLPGIHEGDEMLIVVNEPKHELKIFFKDNWIPHGYDGSARSQKNKQRQRIQYEKWIEHCNNNPFKNVITLKTDLLNECFKVFLLQNSKIARITTPKEVDVQDTDQRLQAIIDKYNLKN